jgi:cation:H+ antiporter
MLLFSLAIIAGLLVLIWSADRFVSGAVATALNLGMTPMMIGLTVVAFGTSAPELIVSATAALDNASHLAIGNAIGSNIANIALVLGATTLVSAIPLKKAILKVEFPVLMMATFLATLLLADGSLDAFDGIGLSIILLISLFALAKLQNSPATEIEIEIEEIEDSKSISARKAYLLLAGSILLLLASSKLLVWGAVGVATELGVSKLIIGLTIVAIGTSLPELAASVASALKGHHDLALGNIIGSNLFNLLAVLAIPALLSPGTAGGIPLSETLLFRDYALMLGLTFGLAALVYIKHTIKQDNIGKIAGTLLLAIYVAYLYVLYAESVAA